MAETDEGGARGGVTSGSAGKRNRRGADERIAALRQREVQLKARRQALEARARQAERKRRTRQLIQLGGVLAAWGVETPEQVEALLHGAAATATGRRRLGALGVRRTGRWPIEG